MRWSKLKKQVEQLLAPTVAGRVRLEATRYRRAHDAEGRWAILVDGAQVGGIGCISADQEEWALQADLNDLDIPRDEAYEFACATLVQRAHHPLWQFYRTVRDYAQASIEDSLRSRDAVARALAYLDRRTGKRRLAQLARRKPETDLEQACLRTRLQAEGITVAWEGAAQRGDAPDRAQS